MRFDSTDDEIDFNELHKIQIQKTTKFKMTPDLHAALRGIVSLVITGYLYDKISSHTFSGFIKRSIHEIAKDLFHVPEIW